MPGCCGYDCYRPLLVSNGPPVFTQAGMLCNMFRKVLSGLLTATFPLSTRHLWTADLRSLACPPTTETVWCIPFKVLKQCSRTIALVRHATLIGVRTLLIRLRRVMATNAVVFPWPRHSKSLRTRRISVPLLGTVVRQLPTSLTIIAPTLSRLM